MGPYRIPHEFTHSADLSITTLVNREIETGRSSASDASGRRLALFQMQTLPQAQNRRIGRSSLHFGDIRLFHTESRMHQSMCEFSVIGQNQKASGVRVESTDGIDPGFHILDQIQHGTPALRIAGRDHHPPRLIDDKTLIPYLLGHSLRGDQQLAAIYDTYDRLRERHEALCAWASYVESVVTHKKRRRTR